MFDSQGWNIKDGVQNGRHLKQNSTWNKSRSYYPFSDSFRLYLEILTGMLLLFFSVVNYLRWRPRWQQ